MTQSNCQAESQSQQQHSPHILTLKKKFIEVVCTMMPRTRSLEVHCSIRRPGRARPGLTGGDH
eukprot:297617-Hanusia_phi.AAC.1